MTHGPPKNVTCQPRKRDKGDTESSTTLISGSSVSDPNSDHVTDLLSHTDKKAPVLIPPYAFVTRHGRSLPPTRISIQC